MEHMGTFNGWAPSVGINDWGITHCWWGRKGVECVDELGVTKKTIWGKIATHAHKSLNKDKVVATSNFFITKQSFCPPLGMFV
jgi:hypothetical protein